MISVERSECRPLANRPYHIDSDSASSIVHHQRSVALLTDEPSSRRSGAIHFVYPEDRGDSPSAREQALSQITVVRLKKNLICS
jgi:hypothetical protein